jgi:hypothetical protein
MKRRRSKSQVSVSKNLPKLLVGRGGVLLHIPARNTKILKIPKSHLQLRLIRCPFKASPNDPTNNENMEVDVGPLQSRTQKNLERNKMRILAAQQWLEAADNSSSQFVATKVRLGMEATHHTTKKPTGIREVRRSLEPDEGAGDSRSLPAVEHESRRHPSVEFCLEKPRIPKSTFNYN